MFVCLILLLIKHGASGKVMCIVLNLYLMAGLYSTLGNDGGVSVISFLI